MKELYEIDGNQFYCERRRYSNATFTTVYHKDESGEFHQLGDPWKAVTPRKSDVDAAYGAWLRYQNPISPSSSPWGFVHRSTPIIEGVWLLSTAGHGGIYVAPKLHDAMPEHMKWTRFSEKGFFEEDCDWCIPFVFFEDDIIESCDDEWTLGVIKKKAHIETFRNHHPEKYAKHFDVAIETLAGRSYAYDAMCWKEAHKNDWQAISAWGDWHDTVPPGMVGVKAKVGGHDGPRENEKYFLVPDEDYKKRERSYVLKGTEAEWVGPDFKLVPTS